MLQDLFTDANSVTEKAKGNIFRRYGLAILFTAIAFVIKYQLHLAFGGGTRYTLFPLSGALATWFGGIGPGLLASALGTLAGHIFFNESPEFFPLDGGSIQQLVLFVFQSVFFVVIIGNVQKTRRRLHESNVKLDRELTDRIHAEKALRESEDRLRLALEGGRLGTWKWSLGDEIIFNDRMYELFGIESTDTAITPGLIGRLIHPDDRAGTLQQIQTAQEKGGTFDVEFRVTRPDGKEVWLYHSGRVFLAPDRRPLYMAGVSLDITERKQLEVALRDLNATLERRVEERTMELEQRNRELSSFAYVASHDLREPLRKVQTLASLLKTDFGKHLDESGIHYLERIEHAGARMSELLSDVLAFSRVASSGEDVQAVRIDEIVTQVLTDLELAIQEAGSIIEVDAPVEIPFSASQLRQLLNHLVLNALKFRRSDVPSHIQIRATLIRPTTDGAPTCRLVVEDNGIGFDQKYEERIFEPFQRLHGRNFPGTGMGLAICRRIVERHNGRISVTSTPGSGTRFLIELPVRDLGVITNLVSV